MDMEKWTGPQHGGLKTCFPVGFSLDPSVDMMQRIQDASIPSLSDSWIGYGTAWLF